MNKWIPVSERLPKVETEVLIQAKKKYENGECGNVFTTAIYEDGTVLEADSCWLWNADCEFEFDEEYDCRIIDEGWWEYNHYNYDADNYSIDDKVIAWQPLPEPYKESEEE